MPHSIDRILQMVETRPWAIDPEKAREILGVLAMAHAGDDVTATTQIEARGDQQLSTTSGGVVHVLPMLGTIMPRADMMSAMSGGVTLDRFQNQFAQAANDPSAEAIILDIDSPGGAVDQVPESAAMIRAARNESRPIVAVANTLTASAAYWIASAADEIVVSPSGQVGSIGVYTAHDDMSEAFKQRGVQRTLISAGARKVERSPYSPLSDEARGALQADVDAIYSEFVKTVASARGVSRSVVSADPEASEAHFGGGRVVRAKEAVRLGMADRVATLSDVIAGFARPKKSKRLSLERAKMAIT